MANMFDKEIPWHRLQSVSFSVFSSEEIRKLSVKLIQSPQVLDPLGSPLPGGLYDLSLGPPGPQDVCTTCCQRLGHCPGHPGHIELPLPVYNPLFFNNLYKLLRGSCLSCHRLTCPPSQLVLLSQQMEALKAGQSHKALQLTEELAQVIEATNELQSEEISKKLKAIVETSTNIHVNSAAEAQMIRNVCEIRSKLLSLFWKDTLRNQRCPHCQCGTFKIRQEHHAKLLLTRPGPKGSEKEKNRDSKGGQELMTPTSAREHLEKIWQNEGDLLQQILGGECDVQKGSRGGGHFGYSSFFLDVLLVPPNRFRPLNRIGDKVLMHGQTANLQAVLSTSLELRQILSRMAKQDDGNVDPNEVTVMDEVENKVNLANQLHFVWVRLQSAVNMIFDSDLDKMNTEKHPGVKQLLESKEGMFRKNMMGKRVDFAARSVICPDMYISADEIGISLVFAQTLTYPVPVTPWNVSELQRAVLRGPNSYPGAVAVLGKDGRRTLLSAKDASQRRALAAQLLTDGGGDDGGSMPTVLRHLRTGDYLLLNRQPSLHRPSVQGHRVRVLRSERVLRLHYTSCKAYNADFDGDEMNAHLPQSETARAEAATIAATHAQYLVPKDGTPLAGLIQDHLIAGALLTCRGVFFSHSVFTTLIFNGLPDTSKKIRIPPPSILVPQRLWAGKQLITALLYNIIPYGGKHLSLDSTARIRSSCWVKAPARCIPGFEPSTMCESQVVVRGGELLCGVLDKAQCGSAPYGLVHCVQQLYGGAVASRLLSCLARILTAFLQRYRGFSLGVEDILVQAKADAKRYKLMRKAAAAGNTAVREALGLPPSAPQSALVAGCRKAHLGKDSMAQPTIDYQFKRVSDRINNQINQVVVPGLMKVFPENALQMMLLSGAKGSAVNAMQISSLLGQIELEGHRPPLMPSGRTLPCFPPYTATPRSGGFVMGRFLTGLEPPEYFFHCMAGREGLVDTAVKTSRSGYLQRCLIKHLEGLVVRYDLTVRDSDNSVVQFLYGHDGIDVTRSPFLSSPHLPFLANNYKTLSKACSLDQVLLLSNPTRCHRWHRRCRRWRKSLDSHSASTRCWVSPRPIRSLDPCSSLWRPDSNLGAMSEYFADAVHDYLKNNGNKDAPDISTDRLRNVLAAVWRSALCHPGEAVGLVAAQSVGEPSTQMTLNTFHFAGRGEMNVTLGIPRLREILMVAGIQIKTPAMIVPFKPSQRERAVALQHSLSPIRLSEVLEKLDVWAGFKVDKDKDKENKRLIKITFHLLTRSHLPPPITPYIFLHYLERRFFQLLLRKIRLAGARVGKVQVSKAMDGDGDGGKGEDGQEDEVLAEEPVDTEPTDGDGDATDTKLTAKQVEEVEYESDEEVDETKDDLQDEEEEGLKIKQEEEKVEEEKEMEEVERFRQLKVPKKSVKTSSDMDRVNAVLSLSSSIDNYMYNASTGWCELSLLLPINTSIDMCKLVDGLAKEAMVKETKGITRCFLHEEGKGKEEQLLLKTEGLNFHEMLNHGKVLDLNRLYCNNIMEIMRFYGIEAAVRVIHREVRDVFAVYGITIDPRHLSLVADYMCVSGTYVACNRFSMATSPSPLQQMTFETSMAFLKQATIQGTPDFLHSPSACLVVGHPVQGGTGLFDLKQPLV
uniref:DNA-directed RNA polymerase I subunit RPA1 n=1 Tax=Myxine glutinosa TaxID=7769 RepID=UPI00358E2EE4